jgi:hypothetical protein
VTTQQISLVVFLKKCKASYKCRMNREQRNS